MLQTICILNDFSSVFGPSNVNVMGACLLLFAAAIFRSNEREGKSALLFRMVDR